MKLKLFALSLTLLALMACTNQVAAQGTGFTYQGRLNDNGTNYTGNAELQPTLWDAVNGGTAVATNTPASVIVVVTNGLFVLPLDFGVSPFAAGSNRWLQLDVRTTIGAFTTLSPRQQLTPTAYAITASSVTGTLPASQLSGTVLDARLSTNVSLLGQTIESAEIADGTIVNADISATAAIADSKLATISAAGKVANSATTASSGNTPLAIVARDASGNFAAGTLTATAFNGSGAGLTALNAGQLTSGTVPNAALGNAWKIGGNTGTTAGTHFLGTTDNQPLELKANGVRGLRIEPNTNAAPNVIGGAPNNMVDAGVVGAFIGGGGATNFLNGGLNHTNRVASNFGVIGGGFDNLIHTNAFGAFIGAGQRNELLGGSSSVIAGGIRNSMSNSVQSFIGSGSVNGIEGSGSSFVGSGFGNNIFFQSDGTIGGGAINQLGGLALNGSISGVVPNTFNTVAGGGANWIADGAMGSTIAGGRDNRISGGIIAGTIPGGRDNAVAGDYGFAAGRRSKANHDGAFVWADSLDADFGSTSSNQFLIRAGGGVGIGTNDPASALHVNGTVNITGGDLVLAAGGQVLADGGSNAAPGISFANDSNTGIVHPLANTITLVTTGIERMRIESGGFVGIGTNNPIERLHVVGNILLSGTITQNSDRNAKTDVKSVECAAILERVNKMPIKQWRFKTEAGNVKHIGPMAQDFHAAFGLGARENGIATVDADGVALAAIQGLNTKLEEQNQRLTEKDGRISALEKELSELKQAVKRLSDRKE